MDGEAPAGSVTVRPLTWVVGAGGLLGQHVVAALSGRAPVLEVEPVPWGHPEAAQVLREAAARLVSSAGGGRWQVIWCAGAGVTGTSWEVFEREHSMLAATLDALERAGRPERTAPPDGALFLASSAGGVYAGSPTSPCDEFSPVRPLADYGRAKLLAEALVAAWAHRTGTPVLVGRIANLYGPGQNLDKPQGLVSQLCAAHLERRPIPIWVSLDTLRDYLYAPDCALLVLDAMDRLRDEAGHGDAGDGLVVTKILGTHRAITVGAVIGELRRIFRRRPTIVLGASPVASAQARDLSLVSRVWPELDGRTLTTFPAGVAATLADLRRRRQQGGR